MTKKELKKVVTEVYDRAILEGKCEVSNDYLNGMLIERRCVCGSIVGVNLDFGSGYLHLCTPANNRKEIIGIFTEFIWNSVYKN